MSYQSFGTLEEKLKNKIVELWLSASPKAEGCHFDYTSTTTITDAKKGNYRRKKQIANTTTGAPQLQTTTTCPEWDYPNRCEIDMRALLFC
jgi:hypothetical protein